MSRIKICGLTRPEDIDCVNQLLPDYIGFVFFSKSSRYISKEKAKSLKAKLDPGIKAVGVFLDNEMEEVLELLKEVPLDLLQFHGKAMDEAFILRVRAHTNLPIIRAFSVETEADLKLAEESRADFILLDSGNGGTGKVFNWKLLEGFQRPYFLAGGLNPENVGGAVSCLQPFAVDVSSGVETDKRKDAYKIKQFIEHVRAEE